MRWSSIFTKNFIIVVYYKLPPTCCYALRPVSIILQLEELGTFGMAVKPHNRIFFEDLR
jgi:hypothetical protein